MKLPRVPRGLLYTLAIAGLFLAWLAWQEDNHQEKGVAAPYGTYQTVPGNSSQTRIFALSASKNSFSFGKLIVSQNDIVRIHFTPKDKTYNISIPALSIKATARLGDVTPIEFQTSTSGTFTITCDNCPDPKPTAILLVQPIQP